MGGLNSLENKLFYFGYDPNCRASGLKPIIRNATQAKSITPNDSRLIEMGKAAFFESIESELKKVDAKEHVIPLSSGVDSRLILSALLSIDKVNNDSITTITFGSPGSWDFEIGQEIAEHFNINSEVINLEDDSFDWSEKSIRNYAASLKCPTKLFPAYVNSKIEKYIHNNCVVWSGFFLGVSVGSHMPEDPAESWDKACEHFLSANEYAPELSDSSYNPRNSLPDKPYISKEKLTYEEQLDFAHRQPCYLRPGTLGNSSKYLTPATEPKWLEYSLNLPESLRYDKKILVDILEDVCPVMTTFPSDMKHGLPLRAGPVPELAQVIKLKILDVLGGWDTHPSENYMDFEEKLRKDTEIRVTVRSLLDSFNERKERDYQYIWREHQNGYDNSTQLLAIASAEAYLSERNREGPSTGV